MILAVFKTENKPLYYYNFACQLTIMKHFLPEAEAKHPGILGDQTTQYTIWL